MGVPWSFPGVGVLELWASVRGLHIGVRSLNRKRFTRRTVRAEWVFRKSVTGVFGIVTDDFGNVTGHFGDVIEGSAAVS